jgi:hypothetical protein
MFGANFSLCFNFVRNRFRVPPVLHTDAFFHYLPVDDLHGEYRPRIFLVNELLRPNLNHYRCIFQNHYLDTIYGTTWRPLARRKGVSPLAIRIVAVGLYWVFRLESNESDRTTQHRQHPTTTADADPVRLRHTTFNSTTLAGPK